MAVYFVTGSSRGFGAEIVREALARGHQVVATARRAESVRDRFPYAGDASANALVEAEWEGPNRVRLTTGGEEEERTVHVVEISPSDGRPLRTVSMG
jgi:NAD(P)-dependent dehydrogenase (short-subunit alcohol dehydrogenase family)